MNEQGPGVQMATVFYHHTYRQPLICTGRVQIHQIHLCQESDVDSGVRRIPPPEAAALSTPLWETKSSHMTHSSTLALTEG